MKRYYPNKSRITTVQVALTADQIAVLINHALYRDAPRALSVQDEVQFLVDTALSTAGAYHELSQELHKEGYGSLAFDPSNLPDPQSELKKRAREKAKRKARKLGIIT